MKKSFVGEQLMARLKALRLPQGLLARVRWIFLLVGSIATVSTVPAVFAATEPWPLRVAALVGILWLFWHWVRGYRRGGFSRAWGAIEGLAVLVIGLALDTPLHVLGVVYNGLVFRSLYGDRRDVAVALLSYLGAFLGAVALSLMVTGPSIPLSELLPHVLGLTLLPLVFHFLKITITKHEQAMLELPRGGGQFLLTPPQPPWSPPL